MKKPKNFEDGLTRLQEILALLADENTPLAQAIKLYAEAAELVAYCDGTLQDAKLQIEEIDLQLEALKGQKEEA